MNAIVAVDENWGIGRSGGLLTHLSGDLKYYKEKTLGKTIVVGRKTLESFPGGRPLPGRANIVLTGNPAYEAEGCIVCHSKAEAEEHLKAYENPDIYISGGAEIYHQFMDDCDTFYVTKILERFSADRFFPNLDICGCKLLWESDVQEENGVRYKFCRYERV